MSYDFLVRVGLPRSTKTYAMVKDMLRILHRNKRWYEKGKIKEKRKVYTNLLLSEKVRKKYEGYLEMFRTDRDFYNLAESVMDSDLFIDELYVYFDSYQTTKLPFVLSEFLAQYAKRGNTIQATTQDLSQVHKRARTRITEIYKHIKIMGNPSPSPTRPKIKHIWGLYMAIPSSFSMTPEGELELKRAGLPSFDVLQRHVVESYDTRQKIEKMKYRQLSHIEEKCDVCGFSRVVHK